MEDMSPVAAVFLIPIITIVGGFVFLIVRMVLRSRLHELEIRERIAMIERGLVPAPEADPRGFERAMQRLERHNRASGSGRHRRAGITLMGVGFWLMVLLAFAANAPNEAIGVG